jgi:hypothetical protein
VKVENVLPTNVAKLRNSAGQGASLHHNIQRKIFVESWRAKRVANQRSVIQLHLCRLQGDRMGAANLTAIKDRIGELAVLPEPKDRTTAARNRRHRQRRKRADTVAAAVAPAPSVAPRRSRYGTARVLALFSALGLAGVSGFFSVVGLTSIFLGSFWPVVAMGSVFEAAKLSAVALLGQRRVASRSLKFAIVTLIVALMALNVVGAYGFLARAQITHAVTGEVQIAVTPRK